MKNDKGITFFTNIGTEKEVEEQSISPEIESKMRALANRIVDIILEDRRQQRLNFQLKNNTIFIGRTKYKARYTLSLNRYGK